MKKILLLAIGLTLFSCSTPEMDQAKQEIIKENVYECGTIYNVLETTKGAELYLDMETEKRVYLLTSYWDEKYSKGNLLCDFSGLTRIK